MNSNSMVCPGAIERYLSCGDTMAAWKSIECIIGAADTCTPGTRSSLRFVILKRIVSPTRARIVGPGTWSPKVQALNFTPGTISIILCVTSRRTSFTGAGSSGFSVAVMDSAAPAAKAPVCRPPVVTRAGGDLKSIVAGSYGSGGPGGRASQATSASVRSPSRRQVRRCGWMPERVRPRMDLPSLA